MGQSIPTRIPDSGLIAVVDVANDSHYCPKTQMSLPDPDTFYQKLGHCQWTLSSPDKVVVNNRTRISQMLGRSLTKYIHNLRFSSLALIGFIRSRLKSGSSTILGRWQNWPGWRSPTFHLIYRSQSTYFFVQSISWHCVRCMLSFNRYRTFGCSYRWWTSDRLLNLLHSNA